jgi:hypothetical protein
VTKSYPWAAASDNIISPTFEAGFENVAAATASAEADRDMFKNMSDMPPASQAFTGFVSVALTSWAVGLVGAHPQLRHLECRQTGHLHVCVVQEARLALVSMSTATPLASIRACQV